MGEICIHAHCGHCRMDKWGARLARGRGCGRYDYYNEKKCGAFLHNAKCKFCSGKGKMSVQSACNACNGTGEYKGERRAQAGVAHRKARQANGFKCPKSGSKCKYGHKCKHT